MRRVHFPFSPLPDGEVTPHAGKGDLQELLQRDVRIVRWFIEEAGWTTTPGIRAGSTLAEMLASAEKLDLHAPAPPVESIETETARYLLHAAAALGRLAWAVRALHGGSEAVDRVDAGFINDELLREDTKERDIQRKLPAGIGTMVLAGRLVQAGGGRIASINGSRGVGHDIHWVTGAGDEVYVERKDRSYEAGLKDTAEARISKVIRDIREAGPKMPRDAGAVRVLVVGFQHLVRKREAKTVDRGYFEALRREFGGGRVRPADLPHIVVVEHLGLEPKTGGEKWDFFSPQLLYAKPKELVRRVGRLLLKALGRS